MAQDCSQRQGGVRGGVQRFDPGAFRRARVAANLSPSQLAALVDVSRQAITRWESGTTTPTPGNLLRARTVLNVEPEALGMPPIASSSLSDLRERAGWLASGIAAELSIDPTTYHSIEVGYLPIPDRLRMALAIALRVAISDVERGWRRSRQQFLSAD